MLGREVHGLGKERPPRKDSFIEKEERRGAMEEP